MKIGVAGVLGRMGSVAAELAAAQDDLDLVAVFDRPGTEGQKRGDRVLTSREAALVTCEVIIDFSTADAAVDLARAAAGNGVALVVGATGFSPEQTRLVDRAAEKVAMVRSGNFSLGVNLLAALVEQAAHRLGGEDWDIEILEAHHRGKRDAPSGSALMLGEAAARGRRGDLAALRSKGAAGPRTRGAIGFASLRGGALVGEHAAIFAGEDEILTLSHSARDRRVFARGALVAAGWVRGRPPGVYGMAQVLGFETGRSVDAG